jgi:AraC-like DNA-binding protein
LLSAHVRHYSDHEQLERAHLATNVELMPTQRGPFEARVVRLEFDRLWMQRVEESAPRIRWAAQSPQRTFVRFLTHLGNQPVVDGVSFQGHEIIHSGHGHSYFEHSSGPLSWGALSLPVDDRAANQMTIAGRNVTLPRSPSRIIPASDAFARLKRLHAEVGVLVEASPELIAATEVSHAIEQSLLDALAECLSDQETQSETWAHSSHDIVMRRFRRMLEAAPDRALYVPEICDAIKVSERTLRLCCQERLGTSPKQYVLLRRMNLARRALNAANPKAATVTEIAMRFGFWHFGRFATCYRLNFGESPSVTLQREPVQQ